MTPSPPPIQPTRWRPRHKARLLAIAALVAVLGGLGPFAAVTLVGSGTGVSPIRTVGSSPAAPALAWPAHGEAAVELEAADGAMSPILTSGGNTPVPIASVAKMMTAYLTLLRHPIRPGGSGFEYTVTRSDVADLHTREAQGQSTLKVAAGEKISEYQLLEGMLVASGNNAAAIVGRYDGADDPALFVREMNASARALKLTHTRYTDPAGLDPGTVSTASDQLRMAEVVMRIPVFAQIVAKPTASVPVAGTLHNYDTLVGTGGFIGIKPGSDSEAKGCFAFVGRRTVEGRSVTLFGVVLGQAAKPHTSFTAASLGAAKTLAASVWTYLAKTTPTSAA